MQLQSTVHEEGAGFFDLFKRQKLELSNTAKKILDKFGNIIDLNNIFPH